MLTEICAELNNYFVKDIIYDDFIITGGMITPDGLFKDGQYYRIVGSVFNDGVYQYPYDGLIDERFSGAIWLMSPPKAFLALADDIAEYQKSDAAKPSPFQSETFAGYSYTRVIDYKSGDITSWAKVFKKRLNIWRKI